MVEQRGQLGTLQLDLKLKRIGDMRVPFHSKRIMGGPPHQVRASALLAALPVSAHVAGDRPEPSLCPRRIDEAIAQSPRDEQRFLGKVFGGVSIAGEMRTQSYKPCMIAGAKFM